MAVPSPASRSATRPALPELGDWDGPIYGQLGVLACDGDRVECHACGRWYRLLASHVIQTHGLSPAEYRAIFGLKVTTGLAGPSVKAHGRDMALRYLVPHYTDGTRFREMTAEERSANARGRRQRLESVLDPHNQAVRREVGRRLGQQLHERYLAGEWTMPEPHDREAALARATARWRELLQDPATHQRWATNVAAARGRKQFICRVCGLPFTRRPGWTGSRTCGEACAERFQRETVATRKPTKRPEVRAKLTLLARRRGRQEIVAQQLRALDPRAFDCLSTDERAVVRLYYGLEALDGVAHSVRQIAELTGLSRGQVEQLRYAAVLRLVEDPQAAGLTSTCVVCGQTFVPKKIWGRDTCSASCARQQHLTSWRAAGGAERLRAASQARSRAAGEQLRALEEQNPAAFDALPPGDRLIVRLYYGLPVPGLTVSRPWSEREIMTQLGGGLRRWPVSRTVKQGVERLLRPEQALSEEERQAAKRALISAAARERGRPGADALRALPAGAFDQLAEPARSLVRRYYGLEDGRAWTRRELAAGCGRSAEWVARAVTRGVARLLGNQAPRAERQCTVCGSPFLLDPGASRSVRKTCDRCRRATQS